MYDLQKALYEFDFEIIRVWISPFCEMQTRINIFGASRRRLLFILWFDWDPTGDFSVVTLLCLRNHLRGL